MPNSTLFQDQRVSQQKLLSIAAATAPHPVGTRSDACRIPFLAADILGKVAPTSPVLLSSARCHREKTTTITQGKINKLTFLYL
ncbi:unnamed protein product [Urochloa humidicola]